MYCILYKCRRFWRVGLLAGLLAGADVVTTILLGTPSALIQSAVAQAPTGTTERPVSSVPVAPPVVESKPLPAGRKQAGTTRALWVLAGGILVAIGFIIFRIFTAKPQAMPTAREDESARVRRHQHRRGQGRTPASREEQRVSETSRDEFMNAPMRQVVTGAPEPKTDLSGTKP
jgi:hypothetical protein